MFVMFVIHYYLIAHIQAHDKSLVFPSFPSSPVSSQNLKQPALQSRSSSKVVVETLLFLKFAKLFPISCLKLLQTLEELQQVAETNVSQNI